MAGKAGGLFGGLPAAGAGTEGEAGCGGGGGSAAGSTTPGGGGGERGLKRPREAEGREEGECPARGTVDPAEALGRLAGVLGSRKKFPAASRLLLRLLHLEGPAGLRKRDHGELLFLALASSAREPTDMLAPELRLSYRKLFLRVLDRAELLPRARLEAVNAIALRAVTHTELHGDDSFAFNAAAERVADALEMLPPPGESHAGAGAGGTTAAGGSSPEGPSPSEPGSPAWLCGAILDCLEACRGRYKLCAWTRSGTERLAGRAFEQRGRFETREQQARVKEIWRYVQEQRARRRQRGGGRLRGGVGARPEAQRLKFPSVTGKPAMYLRAVVQVQAGAGGAPGMHPLAAELTNVILSYSSMPRGVYYSRKI